MAILPGSVFMTGAGRVGSLLAVQIGSPSTLILRSAPQERVSKGALDASRTNWSILRDAASRLLRMRAVSG
jgi:hypothetical protein